MPSVCGFLFAPDRVDLNGLVIQAFDIDIREEALLGEVALMRDSRDYEIVYSQSRGRGAEIGTADVLVRALWDGRTIVESDIRFNAAERERIDLDLCGWIPPPLVPLSELEALEAAIAPARSDVPAHAFSERDILLLAHEAFRSQPEGPDVATLCERLAILRDSAQASRATGIVYPAFYSWFRALHPEPHTAAALNDYSASALERSLRDAVDANIVSAALLDLSEFNEWIAALRVSDPQRTSQRAALQIIGIFPAGEEAILADVPFEIFDEDGSALGSFVTDREGVEIVGYPLPAEPLGATRRLRLVLQGERPGEAEIALTVDPPELTQVRVPLAPAPGEAIRIGEILTGPLADRLRDAGIATFEDLLARPDFEDSDDPTGLAALRARARLTLAAPDLNEDTRAAILAGDLGHIVDVARMPRTAFVRTFAEFLGGEADAHAVHVGLRRGSHTARHLLNTGWLRIVGDPGDDPDPPDLPPPILTDLQDRLSCACEDCENAASPAAYLAHLLDWTLDHVRDVEATITLDQLEVVFHQPFSRLPTDCRSVEQRVDAPAAGLSRAPERLLQDAAHPARHQLHPVTRRRTRSAWRRAFDSGSGRAARSRRPCARRR